MIEPIKYSFEELEKSLKQSHKDFAREYFINGWNKVKAYMAVYPNSNYKAASKSAHDLLEKPRIVAYIDYLKADIEKTCQINKAWAVEQLKKFASHSFDDIHTDWMTRKEFSELDKSIKDCIQEIDTKVLKKNIGTKKEPEIVDVEYVRLKLVDKKGAIQDLAKMLGWNEAENIVVGFNPNEIKGISFE